MKAQDLHPYSSTLVGLNNLYVTVGNSFYINSNCILATDKKITIGKEYIIFDNTNDSIKMVDVTLVDCYYQEEGIINLIVRDIKSKRVFTIHQRLKCPENEWILVDVNFFIDKMKDNAIRQYCGNCNDPKEKSQDDLLDFEY